MSEAFRIYVDFDDVVCETAWSLARLLEREYGKRVVYEDIAYFDLRKSFDLSEEEYREFMGRAHESALLSELPETAGSCATMRAWIKDGMEPVIVTGRPAAAADATREWLTRNGLPEIEVMYVDKFKRDLGPPNPSVKTWEFEELAEVGFALAIDDAPPALELLAESGLCPFVIFDRPWNRGYRPRKGDRPPRVRSWEELDSIVRALKDWKPD